MSSMQPMTDAEISKAAVTQAAESPGDFVAGAHWAFSLTCDSCRDTLWSNTYVAAYTRTGSHIRAEESANDAVRVYDRRVK